MTTDFKAVFEVVTFGIALLGAVLGVYNAWRSWIQDKVRLKVNVSNGVSNGGIPIFLIEIVNLSSFPISITHIGFDLIGTDRHAQIPFPRFIRGESLPVRLETRAAVTAYQLVAEPPDLDMGWAVARRAYVLTACGLKRTSKGSAFDDYRASLAPKR